GGVVAEDDQLAGCGDGEGDVGAVRGAARAVVLVPASADGGLGFVVADGEVVGGQGVGAVAVCVGETGAQAAGLPVAVAAELALEASGGDHDRVADRVGDEVGDRVVGEEDVLSACG